MNMRLRPLSVCLHRLLIGGTLMLGSLPADVWASDDGAPPQDAGNTQKTGTSADPEKAKLLGNITETAAAPILELNTTTPRLSAASGLSFTARHQKPHLESSSHQVTNQARQHSANAK